MRRATPAWSRGELGKALGSFGGSLAVRWDSAQQAGVSWTITTDPLSLVKTAGKHRSKARSWKTFSRGQIANTMYCEP